MIYFKTYFYSHHEVPFLILNLRECYKYVDKFVICEFNYTHTGIKRNYIWDQHKHKFPTELIDKVVYLQIDMSNIVKNGVNNENIIHSVNEPYMRGSFTKYLNLQDNDIIISVDADEIIYGEMYPELIQIVKNKGSICLTLNQFFYRVNYYWIDNPFRAPTIALYKTYKKTFPSQWRYQGETYNKMVGCHFSWCMSVDDMLIKMKCAGHGPRYRHLEKKEILEDAVQNCKYPFSQRSFNIKIIDFDTSPIIPKQMLKMKDDFKDLIF